MSSSEKIITEHGFKTTKKRSQLMKKIGSKDTKAEVLLRKSLWHLGIRYRTNYKKLPGKPDICITKHKVAIFVDGEFWHGYNWEEKKKKIKSNRDYWIPKIERTIQRDKRHNKRLKQLGWAVIRFWEKEVKNNLPKCIKKVESNLG